MIPVFVPHVQRGYEQRKEHIKEQSRRFNLHVQWVEGYDVQDLDAESVAAFTADMLVNQAAVSCALKHWQAWRSIVDRNIPIAMVMEDDIVLTSRTPQLLQLLLREIQAPFRNPLIVSCENSTLRFVPRSRRKSNTVLYQADRLRCAGCYVITHAAAAQLVAHWERGYISQPVDWWMDSVAVSKYWIHPTFAEQGSHSGLFASGIDAKATGLVRRVSFTVQKWLRLFRAWLS
jgi:glycosyl transferase, family 25